MQASPMTEMVNTIAVINDILFIVMWLFCDKNTYKNRTVFLLYIKILLNKVNNSFVIEVHFSASNEGHIKFKKESKKAGSLLDLAFQIALSCVPQNKSTEMFCIKAV